LRTKSGEGTSAQPVVTSQLAPMLAAPFDPHNLGINKVSPESQHFTQFPSAQPVYPLRMPPTIDLTMEEA